MLAARAYLKASYDVDDAAASKAYREKARQILAMQFGREISEIEADLKREIEQGDAFFRQISADEQAWIAAGKQLDTMFAAKYDDVPAMVLNRPNWRPMDPIIKLAYMIQGGLAALIAICALTIRSIIRRARRRHNAPTS